MGLYDAHLRGHFERGLVFGFEESSCCLYFTQRVRYRRKYKTSRSGFSSMLTSFLIVVLRIRTNAVSQLLNKTVTWPLESATPIS